MRSRPGRWRGAAGHRVTAGGDGRSPSADSKAISASKRCAISGVLGIEVRDGCQYSGYTRGGVFGWLFDTGVVSEVVSSSARGQSELGIWSELRGLQPRL